MEFRRVLTLLAVMLLVCCSYAQWTPPFGVPAYHNLPPSNKEALPKLFSANNLTGDDRAHDFQIAAYKAAASIPKVLYQLPCYCYCDRREGHSSLHSCFRTSHAAGCKECVKEALYAKMMTERHASPAQIRAGLQRGEFRNIQLLDNDK